MNILAQCRANVGRSQILEALLEDWFWKNCSYCLSGFPFGSAASAGTDPTKVEEYGVPIPEVKNVIRNRFGYAWNNATVDCITEEHAKWANFIISLSDIDIPDYVDRSRILYWDVKDPHSKGKDAMPADIEDRLDHTASNLAWKVVAQFPFPDDDHELHVLRQAVDPGYVYDVERVAFIPSRLVTEPPTSLEKEVLDEYQHRLSLCLFLMNYSYADFTWTFPEGAGLFGWAWETYQSITTTNCYLPSTSETIGDVGDQSYRIPRSPDYVEHNRFFSSEISR